MDLDSALENSAALSLVLATLVGATVVLGTFGAAASAGITAGLIAFSETVAILVAVFGVLGGLNKLTKGELAELVNGGLDILIAICEGLGTCIGRFVGAIAGGVSDSFEKIGTNLSKFWSAANPFFTGLSSMDQTSVDGAKAFASVLEALFKTSFNTKALDDIDTETIKSYFTEVGEALYSAIHDTNGMGGLTEDDKIVVTRTADIFNAFSGIQTPPDNVWSKLTSATLGLNEYAGQIKDAGKYLNEAFSEENFGSELFADDLIINRVTRLCDIFNAFAGVTIPYSNLSFSTLSSFARNLNNAAPQLVEAFGSENFGNEVFNNGYLPVRAQRIADALTAFSGIPIPPSGLLDDTITKFASNLNNSAPNLTTAIKTIADAGITEDQIASAQNAAAAISAFSSIDSSKLNPDSIVSFINALAGTYAEGGNGLLSKFVEQISNFTTIGDAKESIQNASSAVNSLIVACKPIDGVNCSNLVTFAGCMPSISTNLSTFVTTISGLDSTAMTTAMTNCDTIIDKVKSMNNLDSSGAKGLGETLKKLAKDGIDGFIKKFSDSKTDTDSAVDTLVTNTASAAKSTTQKNKISNAFSELISKGVSTIRNKNSDFNSAGSYCVDGFVIGIDNNIYKVTAAGTRLGNAAYQAAKRAIDSNSPAKKFIELGDFSGQGFVIGMDNMRDKVASSGEGMANAALTSVRDSISRVSDIIQNDIDSQPTIRPVVDLSEAKLGARALSSMFNADTSVSLANQISRNRRSRVQTTNDDVVSAIKELGSNQGNNGNTYNINGITYDDGSNVAEAVRTLIRAAKVERRS